MHVNYKLPEDKAYIFLYGEERSEDVGPYNLREKSS